MRKSNWKSIALIAVAFVIGVAAAVAVALLMPEEYAMYRGLCVFGTLALVSGVLVFIGAKILRIGED